MGYALDTPFLSPWTKVVGMLTVPISEVRKLRPAVT